GIARAPLLQLAGGLQRLDALLPGSRPVLDPSQILPNVIRLRGEFDGLLACLDGSFEVPEFRVRVVGQGPARDRQADAERAIDAFRAKFDGLEVTSHRLVEFSLIPQEIAKIAMENVAFRLEFDGLAVGSDSRVQLPLAAQSVAESDVSAGVVRVDFEGRVAASNRLVEFP